jgi:beta-aspartyl-peptidase (threonine type)
MSSAPLEFAVLLHGGAGVISPSEPSDAHYAALRRIVVDAYSFCADQLKNNPNTTAVDVVEHVVKMLEDEPLFNAGRGAVLTADETHELEASIMDGVTRKCGATMLQSVVKNPISLARAVMEHTPHVCVAGPGALQLAEKYNLELVDRSYFTTEKRVKQLRIAKADSIVTLDHNIEVTGEDREKSTGTVGCVCMFRGHVAAATSTGGLTNKMSGRIGDSPIIGAGTYANDNTCAVSGTGVGEEFMRNLVSYDVAMRMEFLGSSLDDACRDAIRLRLPEDCGGVIAADRFGHLCAAFNTIGMFRASCDSSGRADISIWEEKIAVEL